MKNWKQMTLLATLVGLAAVAHAQGGGQGKMYKYGSSGAQSSGQGGHQGSGGGQGSQTRSQSRTQDKTAIGGEDALRERMRTHTGNPTLTTSTATVTP